MDKDREIMSLQVENDDLLNRLAALESEETNSSKPIQKLKPISEDEDIDELILLANDIKNKINLSQEDNEEEGEEISRTEENDKEANGVKTFQDMLQFILNSVTKVSDSYKVLAEENKALRIDYEDAVDAYNELKGDLDNFVLRQDAEAAIEEVQMMLQEKEQTLWNNLREVNEDLIEIESERKEYLELNTELEKKIQELEELGSDNLPFVKRIEALERDLEDERRQVDEKENEVEVMKIELLNCEAELEAKSTEIKALQDRVRYLKAAEDRMRRSSFGGSISLDNEIHIETLEYIRESLKTFFGLERLEFNGLRSQVDELIEALKKSDEQSEAAIKMNTELTNMVEEREDALTSCELQINELKDEIENLNSELEDVRLNLSTTEERHNELLEEVESVQKAKEDTDVKIEQLKAQITELTKEKEELASKVEAQQEEDDTRSSTKIEELDVKIRDLQTEIELVTTENTELLGQLEELRRSNELDMDVEASLREDLAEMADSLDKLNEDIEILQAENLDLETRNSDLTEEIANLKREIKQEPSELADESGALVLARTVESSESAAAAAISSPSLFQNLAKLLSPSLSSSSSSASTSASILTPSPAPAVGNAGAAGVGSLLKQQAYQHMLELEKDVQSYKEKIRKLETQLQSKNGVARQV